MKTKTLVIFVLMLVMLAGTALTAQSNENVLPDTSEVKAMAANLIKYLHDNDWQATNLISWEDFTLNGDFLGYDYLDAYDYYEEDYFMEDTISRISRLLVYEGSDKDAYTRFTGEIKDDTYFVRTANKKKSITMQLKPVSGRAKTLYELTITDKK